MSVDNVDALEYKRRVKNRDRGEFLANVQSLRPDELGTFSSFVTGLGPD
jgi:hypothetical protein